MNLPASSWAPSRRAVLNTLEVRPKEAARSTAVERLRPQGRPNWYEPPADVRPPAQFTQMVYDGPPSLSKHGGSYGVYPVLGSRFPPGTEILLDDLAHPDEQAAIERWGAKRRLRVRLDEQAGHGIAHLTLR